jgi:hypothetical protein
MAERQDYADSFQQSFARNRANSPQWRGDRYSNRRDSLSPNKNPKGSSWIERVLCCNRDRSAEQRVIDLQAGNMPYNYGSGRENNGVMRPQTKQGGKEIYGEPMGG